MLKALFKKQVWAALSFLTQGKDGKRRSQGAMIGFAVLMVYGFGSVGAMFWLLSETLCQPLVTVGLDWVYFAVSGLMATAVGVIGGIFTAKTALYEAKDNELLLSMPIPSWAILFVRMVGVYLFTLMFEALVFAPAVVRYVLVAGAEFSSIFCGVCVMLLMPLGALAICCLLGFLLAWLTARLPFKNLFTIIGFMAFMVAYFVLYGKMNDYLTYIIANSEKVGSTMNTVLFPFAALGKAASGNWLNFLAFLAMFVGIFALVYLLLSFTYLRVVTTKKGERYAKYKEKTTRVSSPSTALFKREFLRLIKSPMYLLNASMGTFMTVIVCVLAVVNGDVFGFDSAALSATGWTENFALILCAAVCFMASSNTISACSVSLEGETLWLVRSLPVETKKVFNAKLTLHFLMTAMPVAICGGVMSLVLGLAWQYVLLMVLVAIVAAALFAVVDLALNLKFPNLHWTNETAAVKQSLSVVVAMFGGWGISLLPVGGWFLFGKYLPIWGYASICLGVYVSLTLVVLLWLRKRGERIFENL